MALRHDHVPVCPFFLLPFRVVRGTAIPFLKPVVSRTLLQQTKPRLPIRLPLFLFLLRLSLCLVGPVEAV
jgi:hypothetical protein